MKRDSDTGISFFQRYRSERIGQEQGVFCDIGRTKNEVLYCSEGAG